MEIKRIGSQPSVRGPSEWFTGAVRIDPLFQGTRSGTCSRCERNLRAGRADCMAQAIRSVRLSSSQLAAAGFGARGDLSRRSGPVMWSGSCPARSTGMVPRQPRP